MQSLSLTNSDTNLQPWCKDRMLKFVHVAPCVFELLRKRPLDEFCPKSDTNLQPWCKDRMLKFVPATPSVFELSLPHTLKYADRQSAEGFVQNLLQIYNSFEKALCYRWINNFNPSSILRF
ncbi:hypothetical protein AVEN_265484-1 [Araneus ventricosus]|uniref:Uncharacterized protein n=1 Tax=Araneus ventricosus TaxID=182803 RepID=A0A4Y2CGL1_ARAVE|nr:hypothetical protein AVEN_265484-1 [Araneus ventricosus]